MPLKIQAIYLVVTKEEISAFPPPPIDQASSATKDGCFEVCALCKLTSIDLSGALQPANIQSCRYGSLSEQIQGLNQGKYERGEQLQLILTRVSL